VCKTLVGSELIGCADHKICNFLSSLCVPFLLFSIAYGSAHHCCWSLNNDYTKIIIKLCLLTAHHIVTFPQTSRRIHSSFSRITKWWWFSRITYEELSLVTRSFKAVKWFKVSEFRFRIVIVTIKTESYFSCCFSIILLRWQFVAVWFHYTAK
jgi:hypothetical protein